MQQMTIKSRLREKGWYDRTSKFANITREFICSEALLMLSATAIRVYLRMLIKRPSRELKDGVRRKKPKYVYENGPIVFTYNEAECFGIPRTSFARAIRELIEKGFIKIIHPGGTVRIEKGGRSKDWTTYELIDDWQLWGTPDFIPRTKKSVISYSKSIKKYNDDVRNGLRNRPRIKSFPSAKSDTEQVPIMAPEEA